MGCPCSKLEDEHLVEEAGEDYGEAISQCKQRKELLGQAAQARTAFARANAEYLQVLSRTGLALEAFCRGGVNASDEVEGLKHQRGFALEYVPMASQRVVVNPSSRAPPCQQYFNGVVFKPPPPPPGCSSHYWDLDFIEEVQVHSHEHCEDEITTTTAVRCKEVDDDDEEEDMVLEVEGDQVKCTERRKSKEESKHSSRPPPSFHFPVSRERELRVNDNKLAIVPAEEQISGKALEEIMRYVHQEFINASRCGKAVGRMLESSNGNELGLLGASVKALTWRTEDEGVEPNLGWSQALTLERLSAWEVKLYEEVKALALIHSQFNKKRKLLCKHGVNRVHDETVDKTRADTKAVETQMHVAIQATEATAAAIQKITNEELHFQLVELIHGLGEMWRTVHECHERQRMALTDLKITQDFKFSSCSDHRNATRDLQTALVEWQGCMNTLVHAEKEYVRSIGNWLKASIRRAQQSRRQIRLMHLAIPEIYYLCQEWEKSADGLVRQLREQAAHEFIAMVRQVEWYQTEELKAGRVVEGLVKDLNRKVAAVESLERKKKKDLAGLICEKRGAVEWLRQQVEKEKGETENLSEARRVCVVNSVEKGLPRMFQGVYEFARACFEVHRELHDKAKHGIKLTVVK